MLDCLSDLLVVLPQRRIEIDRERFEIRQCLLAFVDEPG